MVSVLFVLLSKTNALIKEIHRVLARERRFATTRAAGHYKAKQMETNNASFRL